MTLPRAVAGANRIPPARRRRRRRGGTTLVFLLVLLVLAWCGYWFAAYSVVSGFFGRADAAPAPAGAPLACDSPEYGGFPLSLELGCAQLTAGAPGFDARIGGLSASAPLYNPGRVNAAAEGPLTFQADALGLGVEAAWDAATATVRADFYGLANAQSTATGLRVALSGPLAPGAGFSLAEWRGTFDQTTGDTPGIRLTFASAGFRLAEGFGVSLPPIDGAGDLTLVNAGPIARPDLTPVLAQWVARGGTIEVANLAFGTGTVRIALSGPLSVSAQGLLSGSLTLRVFGTAGLADLITAILPRFHDEAQNLANAVVALTRPVTTPEGPAQETRLTLRDGAVSIGIVPLLTLPPVLSLP